MLQRWLGTKKWSVVNDIVRVFASFIQIGFRLNIAARGMVEIGNVSLIASFVQFFDHVTITSQSNYAYNSKKVLPKQKKKGTGIFLQGLGAPAKAIIVSPHMC